jgi:lipoprotein NlpI
MPRARVAIMFAFVVLAAGAPAAAGDPADPPIAQRIRAATAAIEANPQDADAYDVRARLHAASGQLARAIADYDRLIALDPARAEAYDARGSEHFKAGHIDASIADFDRFIRLRPEAEAAHWKRGISYYYAGRYDDGRRQFEGYQTVDDSDVENAVWRFLCMARAGGVEAARGDMLMIKPDPRAGMMKIYDLFRGVSQPDEVLATVRSGKPSPAELNERLFYAHLYLGLYCESILDAAGARKHLSEAVGHKIGHYMWNVADVHAKRLPAAAQ